MLLLPHSELRGPRTWAIAPSMDDAPLEGRDRRDASGFHDTFQPRFLSDDQEVMIETSMLRLTVTLRGGFCA